MTSFLDYKKDSKLRLFEMGGRVGMSKNSWPMPRRYEPPSRTISGRGMIDHPKIIPRLKNAIRREPGSIQQARVSHTKGHESQMKNMPKGKTTTFACDVEGLATMHQPA
jgi:hypothetical protein